MADNTTLDPGAGGDTIATDDIGGVKHQQVKVEFGADGTATPVDAANPFPVTTIASALPTGAATAAKQDTGNTSLASIDGKITECDTGAVVVASSALPTGASTAAKQPALGTAGTASADVISVQGIASMTPIATTAVGPIADDSTTPGAPVMVGGSAKSPDGTDPGNVSAEDDVARNITDLNRRVYVNTEHPRWGSFHSDGSTALADEVVAADPGDGFQIVITEIMFSNGADAAINIFFETGSTKILGPWYLSTIGGIGWKGKKHVAASEAVTVTTSASQAQSCDVQYYIQKV